MIELLLDWVIVGPFGSTLGSFRERYRADEYIDALQRLRGVDARVENRETYLKGVHHVKIDSREQGAGL